MTHKAILPNLLTLAAQAIPAADAVFDITKIKLQALVTTEGRVSNKLIEKNQTAAHGFAWLATYIESLRQMENWALNLQVSGKFGEVEQLILQITFGEYLCQMAGGIPMNQGEIFRLHDIGLSQEEISTMMVPAVSELMRSANSQSARLR